MPDSRSHRGPHPEDARLFAPEAQSALRAATDDLCWLLSRGYAPQSALALVGDHYQLAARQRGAVGRCACSDDDLARRRERLVGAAAIAGQVLRLDGYNVLTTVEAALAGGVVLAARDGAFRDIASMHGSFRKVAETQPALEILGEVLAELRAAECFWYFDRPVSNSGRLKKLVLDLAVSRDWPWGVELVTNPDVVLSECDDVIASADSAVLDRCHAWLNLAREATVRRVPQANVVTL